MKQRRRPSKGYGPGLNQLTPPPPERLEGWALTLWSGLTLYRDLLNVAAERRNRSIDALHGEATAAERVQSESAGSAGRR